MENKKKVRKVLNKNKKSSNNAKKIVNKTKSNKKKIIKNNLLEDKNYKLAEKFLKNNDFESAYKEYLKLCEIYPKNKKIYKRLIESLTHNYTYKQKTKDFKSAMDDYITTYKILCTKKELNIFEKKLVEYNELSKVDVYKAGHHGSYTAGSEELLSVIDPNVVCICCCAGSDEYTDNPLNMFPAQDFISRICKYTDQVFVTTLITDTGFESMNGNIVITSNNTGLVVNCSNNNIILKDTEWFKKNRKWE